MTTLLWLALAPFWKWSRLSKSYSSCHLITSLHWSSLSHLLHSSLSVHTGHSAFWVSASHLSTEVPNISICTHRQSDTNTDTPHFPVCVFHNVCVQLTFYCSLSAGCHLSLPAPLSNFPTDCLLSAFLCFPLLSHYLCSPIWDGMPESPPSCCRDLNIVCPVPIFLLPICLPVHTAGLSQGLTVSHFTLSLLIMSADQFVHLLTFTDTDSQSGVTGCKEVIDTSPLTIKYEKKLSVRFNCCPWWSTIKHSMTYLYTNTESWFRVSLRTWKSDWKFLWSSSRHGPMNLCARNPLIKGTIIRIIINSYALEGISD